MATKRPRAEARALARAEQKQAEARQKLFLLERGGNPARPLEVSSPSIVEPRATSLPCPRCLGELRVREHAAKVLDDQGREGPAGAPLRVVTLACFRCGAPQRLYFRVVTPLPS